MTSLSVNVNKLATLRNSRGKNLPDVTALSRKILEYGAHGLTVHPRPDGRHIRTTDVHSLRALVDEWNEAPLGPVEYNIEGYPSEEFILLIQNIRPNQATLVPDPPEALTSNAGWDLLGSEELLRGVLSRLGSTRVSLFVDPLRFDEGQAAALARLKPARVELYTEAFADGFAAGRQDEVIGEYRRVADAARALGIGVNAGHDLNQQNLPFLLRQIPWIEEVSIGHALICEALEGGLEDTIRSYLRILGSVG